MAIKLRKFSRNRIVKFIAFTLTVIILTAFVVEINYLYIEDMNPEVVFIKNYTDSEEFKSTKISRAIRDVINHFLNDTESIKPKPEYQYYVTDGEKIKNNASLNELFEQKDYLYIYEDQQWFYGENTYKNIQSYVHDWLTLYLVFPQEYLGEMQQQWDQERALLLPIAISFVITIIFALICIIYLIGVTGRRPEDDEVHLDSYMDRVFTDIQLGIMLLTGFIWLYGLANIMRRHSYSTDVVVIKYYVLIMSGVLTSISIIICGVILLSLIRKIKARRFLRHSLIYAIFAGINKFIRSFFDDSRFEHFPLTKSLNRRQVIFTVLSGSMVFLTMVFWAASGSFFVGLIPVFAEGVIIYWYFNENRKTFDEINQGFRESLQEQMKSERMKVDLITNVSHDLKTPLTSIISYVDLLSNEELPESARDYVNILADKSGRLKNIVSDLFDLAKSTSGNLPLNMENLDLRKLIEQTLGDMEDDIEKSGLRIKTTLTETPVYIYSDGKKLYRVFQNIIANALKYSLGGTRVFIDMEIQNNHVNVSVKNTASYDMDFTAEDILQRFTRGDESRTTEGSGLGLSIAESFTWACGGKFKVEIDGDQFKVRLEFPVVG